MVVVVETMANVGAMGRSTTTVDYSGRLAVVKDSGECELMVEESNCSWGQSVVDLSNRVRCMSPHHVESSR